MVGVVGLTFSVLVFYAEKDNKEKEWTFLDSFCWGLMTLTTGKSAFDLTLHVVSDYKKRSYKKH